MTSQMENELLTRVGPDPDGCADAAILGADLSIIGTDGIVNLAARGMLVVSVARRLGLEGHLPANVLHRSNRAAAKRRRGSAKLTMALQHVERRNRV